jgi:predicted short-subunit dehydrogenase-like oxidoreductase (DUF2520 family)
VARCLAEGGRVRPGRVVNRRLERAHEAAAFTGGEAAENFTGLADGGWLMLGLPDGVLADDRFDLSRLIGEWRPELVFHLSGSVPACVLELDELPVASVHPVRAFSDPEAAARRFRGTWCVAEGDPVALDRLRPAFEAAGSRWLPFEARDKAAWHAATVAASNYLVTIQALAGRLADRAGLPEPQARDVLCDLQQGTLDLLREREPREVLTGPIERGDAAACVRLVRAASSLEEGQSALFSELGRATLALARAKRGDRNSDADLAALFSPTSD